MNERNYIFIVSPYYDEPPMPFADTVVEETARTRLLDSTGKPFEYAKQKLGFDLSRKDMV